MHLFKHFMMTQIQSSCLFAQYSFSSCIMSYEQFIFRQMGFAMLEAGFVRTKNSSNILLKNMLDTYIGAIIYYLIGYGFANDAKGGLIGQKNFASDGFDKSDYLNWIFQYSVCSNIPTIVAGSLAERTFVDTYMYFSLLLTGIIYPIAAAWTWGGGWLQEIGYKDFGGAGVVHLLGGCCGMVGTIILGPRLGIFGLTQQGANEKNTKDRQNYDSFLEDKQVKSLAAFPKLTPPKSPQLSKLRKRRQSKDDYGLSFRFKVFEDGLEINQPPDDPFKRTQRSRANSQQEMSDMNNELVIENQGSESIQMKESDELEIIESRRFDFVPPIVNINEIRRITPPSKSPSALSNVPYFQLRGAHSPNKYSDEVKVGQDSFGQFFMSPRQKARLGKIRKVFPEFNLANDRQLNQIIKLYDMNIKNAFRPSSIPLIVQGTFFLWTCWLFFNAGSAKGISMNQKENQPSKIIMNTIISSAGSCISVLFLRPFIMQKSDPTNKYPVKSICNSLLVGLVSITGVCNNATTWGSILIGILGGIVYLISCKLFEKLKIDDPLEASQIHAFTGLWGTLAIGIFDTKYGVIYTGSFDQLLLQLIGVVAISLWAGLISFLYFYCLKKVNKFRVGYIYEITGMDVLMHGGTDILSSDIINKIEAKQRAIANRNHK